MKKNNPQNIVDLTKAKVACFQKTYRNEHFGGKSARYLLLVVAVVVDIGVAVAVAVVVAVPVPELLFLFLLLLLLLFLLLFACLIFMVLFWF